MIACKVCQTHNGIDAKFCKSCGQALPEDAIQEALQRHEQMIAEGYTLFNAGRTEDAILVATAAVEENSNSVNALSLLGMCYERTGQFAEALECFEKVLGQNPDSALDRMKVTQLRHSLTSHIAADHSRHRNVALLCACGAVVLLCLGGVVYALSLGDHKTEIVASNAPAKTSDSGELGFQKGSGSFQVTPTSSGAPVTQQTSNQSDGAGSASADKSNTPQTVPQTQSNTVAPTDKQTKDDIGDPVDTKGIVPPITVQWPGAPVGQATQTQDHATAQANDPQPTPDSNRPDPQKTAANGNAATDPAPAPDNGVVDIKVSQPAGTADSSQASSSPNMLQALMKTGRDQFLLGHFDASSRSYESALRAGGDAATINQRLGMCYEKLGKADAAIAAYSRAATAFQGELSSGQGDSKRLKSGLDSCKQAIKLLKG